jgi:hypothetical protein
MSLTIDLVGFEFSIETAVERELRLAQEEYDQLEKTQVSLVKEKEVLQARIQGLGSLDGKTKPIKEEYELLVD